MELIKALKVLNEGFTIGLQFTCIYYCMPCNRMPKQKNGNIIYIWFLSCLLLVAFHETSPITETLSQSTGHADEQASGAHIQGQKMISCWVWNLALTRCCKDMEFLSFMMLNWSFCMKDWKLKLESRNSASEIPTACTSFWSTWASALASWAL